MVVSLSPNWNAMKKWMMLGLCLAIGVMALRGQSDSLYKVAFYNVENLFHPSDDSLTADEAFTPTGSYHWSYAKYWSFSFSISPSNEHLGLISFRMDWLDLLAVYGTLKSLLRHHSSKASILRRSAFFTVQLSHPYTMKENVSEIGGFR